MTETELRLMAAPAIIGESSHPKNGNRSPAATGMPRALEMKARRRFCGMLVMVAQEHARDVDKRLGQGRRVVESVARHRDDLVEAELLADRLGFQMHAFHGWKAGALWEDIKFGARHLRDIERIAMVGDKAWEHGMALFCKPFTGATIKYFDSSDAGAARVWIQANTKQ